MYNVVHTINKKKTFFFYSETIPEQMCTINIYNFSVQQINDLQKALKIHYFRKLS